jgi:hypothetical protein
MTEPLDRNLAVLAQRLGALRVSLDEFVEAAHGVAESAVACRSAVAWTESRVVMLAQDREWVKGVDAG